MKLENYLRNGKFYVWKGRFAVIKSKRFLPNAFAAIKDKKEITVVIDQSKIKNNKNIINIDKNWKIITFDMLLPFELVGFIAKISNLLSNEKISIFVVSSYSTDHILVREKCIKKAIAKLESLGLKEIR